MFNKVLQNPLTRQTPWELRMEHERAWRDSGVESGCRQAPKAPDGPGYLTPAGVLRKNCPELDTLFRAKGHDSMIFEKCKCSQATH